MDVKESIYKGLLSYFNRPYIPKDLIDSLKGPLLLHISDTPVEIYNFIFRLLDILRPQYIIHTGDMADNIKLEIRKNRLDYYYQSIAKLIQGLEKYQDSKTYYVLGNHDNYKAISKLSKRGTILADGLIKIEDFNFLVSHYFKAYPYKADFSLYGHSPLPNHSVVDGVYYLNGIVNINLIDLSNGRVYHLDYPSGTNSARGFEFKRIKL